MGRFIRVMLLILAVGAIAFAAYRFREQQREAEAASQQIEDELDSLDPATRAAVVSRLAAEEVERVRGKE